MTGSDSPQIEKRRCRFSFARLPTTVWAGILFGVLALVPNDARPEQKSEFTVLRIASPDAREISISDKARLDDVLQVLRDHGVTFERPEPIILKGVGEPQIRGHRLTIRLATYDPRGGMYPGCPYQQKTELSYDLEGRLYEYRVVLFLTCVP